MRNAQTWPGADRLRAGLQICDHLPLNGQSGIYARERVDPDRSTLADWVGRAAWPVAPEADRIGDYSRAGPGHPCRPHADPGSGSGRGRTQSGQLWVVGWPRRPRHPSSQGPGSHCQAALQAPAPSPGTKCSSSKLL
ncbi:IS66 family transposase [Mesorhizobium loti]|uniref:IS66 family transposase n=1 Tax=Rhizobium loti TaxID=381 RepID=UPI003D7C3519